MKRLALQRWIPFRLAALVAPLLAAWPLPQARAQSIHHWTGGGTSPLDWTDATNWLAGSIPDGNDVVNMAGAGGGSLVNVYSGFANQYQLWFNPGAGNYTLNGPAPVTFFDFGGNAPKIENNATGTTQTLNFGVVLNGTNGGGAAEINPVDGNLVLNSTLDLAGTTQLRVWGGNGNTLRVEGAVSSSGNGGNNTIAINQNSLLFLKGANSYNGDTFINAGELRLANSTQSIVGAVRLGDTSGSANAAYSLANTGTGTGVTIAKALEVRSGSSGLKTLGNTGVASNAIGGAITLNSALTIAPSAGSQLRLTGAIGGAQPMTVSGGGLTYFGGTNTYTGQTTVGTGALLGLTGSTVTLGTSSPLGNTGAGNETIVQSGGTLNLGGAQFGNQAPGAANNEIFRIAGSGVGGLGALINTIGAGTNATSKVVLTADASIGAGAGIQTSYGSGGNILTSSGGRFDIRQSAAPTAGQAHLDLAGFTLTKTGSHLLALVNTDVSNGNIIVNDGQLNIEAGTLLNGSGTITVNQGGRLGFWGITAAANVTRSIVVNGGTIGDPTSTSAAQTVNSPIQFTGSVNPSFVAVSGSGTTLAGVISQSAFTGTGLDKRGVGLLAFNNIANTFSAPVSVYAGTLRADYTTTITGGVPAAAPVTTTDTPLGTNNNITLAGGTLAIRANMDNNNTNQRWSHPGNITIDRAPSGMTFDRIGNATQTDKNILFNSITIAPRSAANGWSIGQNQFTFSQINTHRLEFSSLTLGNDTNLVTGDFTFSGSVLSANRNSLQKTGANSWGFIGGTTQEFNALYISGTTQTRVGSMFGTALTSNTVTAGTGPIFTAPNNSISFRSPTNLAPGQIVEVKSQMQTQNAVNFENAFTSIPTNLRAIGSGVIGLGGNNSMGAMDLSRVGNGTFRIGAGFGGQGAGTVTGAITPGAGGVVRTGGGNTVTLSAVNAVSGGASLEVGSDLINAGFRTTFNGTAQTGTTTLTQANNYTGGTAVNRSSQLNVQNANSIGTGAAEVYGVLALNGTLGTLASGVANTNAVNLRGGSTLLFDNAPLTGTVDLDRWGNSAGIALNASTLTLNSRNNNASTTTETVGALTYAGGSIININRQNAVAGNVSKLSTPSLTRTGTGTVELVRTSGTGAGWGVGNFLEITAPPVSTNGMIDPHAITIDGTRLNSFATYTGGTINVAALTSTITTGTPAGSIPTGLLPTGNYYVDFATANTTLTLADNPVVYALKLGGGTSATTLAIGGANNTVTLRSGGLIFAGDNTAGSFSTDGTRTVNFAPNLVANNGTADIEAIINTRNAFTGILTGTVQANGLTKFGAGTLALNPASPSLVGTVSVNQGVLQAHGPAATATHNVLGTGNILLQGGQLNLRSQNAAVTGTINPTLQNNGLTVGAGIPLATVDLNRATLDVASTGTFIFNPAAAGGVGLVLQGSPGIQGQTLNVSGANYALQFGSNAVNSLTGNVTINNAVTLTMNNAPTITAPNSTITKVGGGTWIVGAVAGNPTGPTGTKVVLNGGTLELRSVSSFGVSANTSLELNSGTLNLRRDTTGAVYGTAAGTGAGYPVSVNGNSAISVGFVSAGSNQLLTLGATTIRNDATLTANSANGYGLGLDSINLAGTGFLVSNIGPGDANNGAVRVGGVVSGGSLVKLGGQHLHLVGAASTFDGGLFANAGYTRLRAAGAAGTGTVTLNPGAALDFNAANNLNPGQQLIVNSTPAALAMISMNTDVAHPTAGVNTVNAATGVIGLSNTPGGTYNTTINMAALYGGRWSLGGISSGVYDGRYTAPTLGVGADNLYRFGGGGQALHIGFSSANVQQNNVLTGAANSVRVGFDSGNIYTATAATPTLFQLSMGGTNNYGGSTVIHRGTPARAWASAAGGTSAFGTGAIDVFGTLGLSGAGTLVDSSGNPTNALTLHPASSLVLDNNGSQTGAAAANIPNRIADSQAINLKGSLIDFIGNNNNPSTETLGTVTIGGSSRIRAARTGTGTTTLTITNLNGTGTAGGSLLLQTSAAAQLGLPAGDRIVAGNLGTVAMVDPRVVNYTDGQFVGHDTANGFVNITPDVNLTGTGTLNTGLAATTKLNIAGTGTYTLGDNPTIHSLRTDRDINNGGPFNRLTLRSGGLLTVTNTVNMQPDLVFNDGSQNIEARITNISGLVILGQITANGITKAGAGQMFVRVPQPNYSSGWTVNSGDLIFDDPNAPGQSVPGNTITINGSTSTGGTFSNILGANLGTASRVVFRFDNQSPENVTFSGGPINVWNEGTIQAVYANTAGTAANDRNGTIPAISLNSSSTLSSVGLNIDVPNSRNRTVTPSLTLNADGTLRVIDGGSTGDYGRSISFAVNSLVGTNKNLIKIGNRTLELPNDNSGTFTGGSVNIGQGSVIVRNNGSLGSAGTAVTIERNATLEIGASNYTPVNTSFTQKPGSSERWDVEDARGASYNLPSGVNLQLNTNLLSARTIGLNGGTIEGFLYSDHVVSAALRTIDSPVNINLLANSFVGQNILQGATYDTGRQPTVAQPFGDTYTGASLDIRGTIAGAFDLTKTGLDTVQISGTSNTYNNTYVDMGVLRIGANNALPAAGALVTRLGGTFDLYGFDQTVSALGTGTGYTGGGVSVGSSGRILSSGAVVLKTLTANQSVNTTYNGSLEQNLSLTKSGTGVLTLGNPDNSYRGVTTVSGGVLSVNKLANGSTVGNDLTSGIGQSSAAPANLVFTGGGLLRYTGGATGSDRQFTLGDGGGGFESSGAGPLALTSTSPVTHTGTAARTLVFGGTNTGNNTFAGVLGNGPAATNLTKRGTGNWALNGISTHSGITTIESGTLALAATAGIPNSATVDINAGGNFDVSAVAGGFMVDGKTVIVNGTLTGNVVNTGSGLIQGTGTITGTTTLTGGTISPGNSPGILNTGSVTTSLTAFQFEIGGLSAGTQYDRINTTGTISLGGDSTLVISLINSYIPNQSDTFDIWLNDSGDAVAGTFNGLPEGSQIPIPSTSGGPLDSDYWVLTYAGNTGNDIRLTYIPEPSTALLAGGLCLLALGRRRRDRRPS